IPSHLLPTFHPSPTRRSSDLGVLYVKGMNPGPTLFLFNPQTIYAVFLIFILANLIMIPLGWILIKFAKNILRVSKSVLMPLILRSEEHTSDLQSRENLVCRLL